MGDLWVSIRDDAIKLIGLVVGSGLSWFLAEAIKYLREKRKIAISEDLEKRLVNAVPVGIKRAEEWARKEWLAVQDPANPKTEVPTGERKLEEAKKTIASIVPEFTALPEDTQAAYIDAKLLELRPKLPFPLAAPRPSQIPPLPAGPLSSAHPALRAPALPTGVAIDGSDDKDKDKEKAR